jgi:hypothetical protein
VLTELPPEELFWSIQFMIGALHRALLVSSSEDLPVPKAARKLDAEGLLRRLVAFAAQGMSAPCTP